MMRLGVFPFGKHLAPPQSYHFSLSVQFAPFAFSLEVMNLASQPQFLHQLHQVGISTWEVHFAHQSPLGIYQLLHVTLGQLAQE